MRYQAGSYKDTKNSFSLLAPEYSHRVKALRRHPAWKLRGMGMSDSIIVIGAGAAGLLAARQLSAAGYAVFVLEAAAQPGGRILTLRPGGEEEIGGAQVRGVDRKGVGFSGPVEAGAEFIHGKLPISLQLAKEAGILLHPIRARMARVRQGDWANDGDITEDWGSLLQKMEEVREDLPVSRFLLQEFAEDKYAGLRDSVRRFAEGYDLADLDRVSTRALYKEWAREGEEEEYRPEGGYRRMIDHLVRSCQNSGCTFHFSTIVRRVRWQRGRVKVETADGRSFQSQRLICTASLGVLEEGGISFEPVLPEQAAAVRQLGFGHVTKILLEFKTSFWNKRRKGDGTLFVLSDEKVPTWWTSSEPGSGLLTGWLTGENRRNFLQLETSEQIDQCLSSLAVIFSEEPSFLRKQLTTSLVLDWAGAPYIRGGYSYETVEASHARAILTRPVEQTLYFSGEALYEGIAPGTVEAAFSSGKDVADKIMGA